MEIAIVYSRNIITELIPASGRFEVLLEFPVKFEMPGEVEVEPLLLKFHDPGYVTEMKNHPFYHAAVENVRCIAKGVEILKSYSTVVVPVTAAGHLAERDRMRGYCLFNGLAIAASLMSEQTEKVAIIETDAHHGVAAIVSSEKVEVFCLGGRKCRISDDLRCVLGRQVGKRYVESFEKMVERVKRYEPRGIIWYLGADIDSREYSEMELDVEDVKAIMARMAEVAKGKKLLILLSSGSKPEVIRDFVAGIVNVFKK
ncbi:hypothetical protein [Archaeoglobus neptunius]|uniref:hypothetical protein n=1 Tax=Archaeoglobus neptunius TaxID=2798580 RepID=UPI001927022A|nr:hypothetical protein [Archaeoglobus neptunius]